MLLTVPETLLLFALHDERGTVHSVAYIGLDHALRGAVLAELKLRGYLQVRTTGEIRFNPTRPPPPPPGLLRDTLVLLANARNPAPVQLWYDALALGLPNLRQRILDDLEARGILVPMPRARRGDPEITHPMADERPERRARKELHEALALKEDIAPRHGILVALTVAVHLDVVVFEGRREQAEQVAAWVSDRDSIVRSVTGAIRRAEGDW